MDVVFVTREPDVCAVIASHLERESVRCSVKNNFLEFLFLLQQDQLPCDLLVCDFCQFQHMLCNIGDMLRQTEKTIPVIFYNDPYPTKENRVIYWLGQNEALYRDQEFHHLIPYFKALNDIIENPAVHPYISLLQPPLPIGVAAEPPVRVPADDSLMQFRLRNKIPPSLFSLFEFFYGNISKELTIKDIARQISGKSFPASLKRTSVYSYVSRLKKYMQEDPFLRLAIIRSASGRYKMIQYGNSD